MLPEFPRRAPDASEIPALSLPGLCLRRCRMGDMAFLRRLYRHLRDPELDRTGWAEGMRRVFCTQQFDAQHSDYVRRFPQADFLLILCRRDPVGRLYVDLSGPDAHLIEIGLLPSWRGRGIGGAVLSALQERAGREGGGVTLHVDRTNHRALALYRRFGFLPREGGPPSHLPMRWDPPGA